MKKILCVLLIAFLLLSGCGPKIDYVAETHMVRSLLQYYEDPALYSIQTLTRYDVSQEEVYYYVQWSYSQAGTSNLDYLAIYDTQTHIVTLAHFRDMESGYFAEVYDQWRKIENKPTYRFSHEEISRILSDARALLAE